MQTVSRENAFDFLRLAAALMVVIHHAVVHLDAPFLWHSKETGPWFHGGVSLFFILSGFLIVRSAEKCHAEGRRWWDFYRNRALRIVPALYAYFMTAIILLLALGVLEPNAVFSMDFGIFVGSNLIFAPVYSPTALDEFGIGVLNGSLWTIPVEVSFYIIVPLIVLLASRFGWKVALTVSTLIAVVGIALYAATGGAEAGSILWKMYGITFIPFLWFFVIGIVWSKIWPLVRQSGWIAVACLLAYFTIINLPHESRAGLNAILTGLAALPLSYSAIWFGYNAPKAFYLLTKRIGDLSFGTYIWHMIVVNVLIFAGARNWEIPGTLLILGVVASSMLIASVSWHFVEHPALRLKGYSIAEVKRFPSQQ
ncbi:acyltransferase family protein [Glutamicibacter nicotianae]|uniref:acyltransferase family protein n=1 Tax=Glutamicibacter nicotianae TaxID=37929 RepID=UPI00255259FB|nr:acyltransferase [Glutamicibacter nicotianae]WIV45302.1 acyltransferase [Glutamicibacter nicotianae]